MSKSIKFEKSVLPAPRGVAFSASRSSLLSAFCVRPSVHSASGFVAAVVFSSRNHALAFSRAWSRRLPRAIPGCAVRSVQGGFAVSVPVRPVAVPAACVDGAPVSVCGSSVAILRAVLCSDEFQPLPLKAVPLLPGVCCRLGLCASAH